MKDLSIVDHYSEMDIDELEFALEDLNNAISCEEYCLRCMNTDAGKERHLKTISKLKEEAAYVRKLKKELMVE